MFIIQLPEFKFNETKILSSDRIYIALEMDQIIAVPHSYIADKLS